MRTLLKYVGVALILATSLAVGPRARADDMNWSFVNGVNQQISIQLYSITRQGHVWPGAGTDWLLPANGQVYTESISCDAGEKICYGAWPTGNQTGGGWGVGYNNTASCPDCCGICGKGNMETFRLNQ